MGSWQMPGVGKRHIGLETWTHVGIPPASSRAPANVWTTPLEHEHRDPFAEQGVHRQSNGANFSLMSHSCLALAFPLALALAVVPLAFVPSSTAPTSPSLAAAITTSTASMLAPASPTAEAKPPAPPTHYAVLLFDGFQALDVFGPLDVLNMLSRDHGLRLSIVAARAGSVSTRTASMTQRIGQDVTATHTLATAPRDIEVLLIPGGMGTRLEDLRRPEVAFIRSVFPRLRFLLTVCTGSSLAARAGVLDGREATTNKRAFDRIRAQSPRVHWVRQARWVRDGNVWTSSGISAGIDMMYAFVGAHYGEDVAAAIAWDAEYTRNLDPSDDPFSEPRAML
ncbi:ThiJ/PfpI family protein [Drechmeria coniospora]|uniref:ThiJ/PfpI family protein n=1 Tax=Drechmeria coniospora TaxID=98403 RepID=A0A151GYB8_DRECN|nr:ThiJ/PfpI family protein [Drechmeria coniospora]KYK62085.1 ThiJ/PfpI family protein [Drechmeria coniospora]